MTPTNSTDARHAPNLPMRGRVHPVQPQYSSMGKLPDGSEMPLTAEAMRRQVLLMYTVVMIVAVQDQTMVHLSKQAWQSLPTVLEPAIPGEFGALDL